MAPALLTPPSSGSETSSPLAGRSAKVSKRKPPRRSSTGKFTWKTHHRITLRVCHQRSMSSRDITEVFNAIYRDDCALAGYHDGISPKTLQSQWQDHKKPTSKAWREALAASEAELEVSRREIEEHLVNNPLRVRLAPVAGQPSPNARWKTSTANTRVQTFDAQTTPCSTAATAPALVNHVEDTINVATEPLTPVSNKSSKKKKTIKETISRPSSSVRPGPTGAQSYSKPVSTYQPLSIMNKRNKFPAIYDEDRTRVVDGQHVPLAKATGRDLKVDDPVTEDEAHSPMPVLLFRFYDDETHSVRHPAAKGEIAPYYACLTMDIPGPPPCHDDRLFATIANHINHVQFTGELLSTTSNLFFALRKAAKSNSNPRIKVIRGCRLPRKGVYHALPWHRRLKENKLFFNGKYMNSAYHEYLVWAKIPYTAELCDFAFSDLERHLMGNPHMQQVLRIDELRSEQSNTELLKRFANQNLELSITMVEGLAKFLLQFEINVRTPGAVIARLVSETMRGFVIGLSETVPQRWNSLAGAFAWALTADEPKTTVPEKTLIEAKEAFKTGLASSLGDINWHLFTEKKSSMLTKVVKRGLETPMVLIDTVSVAEYQTGSLNAAEDSQVIDLTADDEDDSDDDQEEHSIEGYDEGHGYDDGRMTDVEDVQANIERVAQSKTRDQRPFNSASKHNHDHAFQEKHQIPDDSEGETIKEIAAQPSGSHANLFNKYRLADTDKEHEIDIDDFTIPGPRLS